MKGYFSSVSFVSLIQAQTSLLPAAAEGVYSSGAETGNDQKRSTQDLAVNNSCGSGCDIGKESSGCGSSCGSDSKASGGGSCQLNPPSFRQRLLNETWQATGMVIKFMLLAFFLEALIIHYVPTEWIAGLLGAQNPYAILTAALIGVPVYTSNLAALPMISGLLAQGMSPAAALAFLIAGPTTTLPAMAAVWGLTTRRVFALYVSFSLIGAIVLGYVYSLISIF